MTPLITGLPGERTARRRYVTVCVLLWLPPGLGLATMVLLFSERGMSLAAIAGLFALLGSPWTWLVILFALTPVAAAYMFTTDRDFGNWVTNLRISSNVGEDYPYAVVSALGDGAATAAARRSAVSAIMGISGRLSKGQVKRGIRPHM